MVTPGRERGNPRKGCDGCHLTTWSRHCTFIHMSNHTDYLTEYYGRLRDENDYVTRGYWADMTYGPNLMVGYEPSILITTCCYGNCARWAHGNTATHRWFTPDAGLPFVALCKGHAKQERDAGHDVVAYSTLVRLRDEASTKAYDAYKRIRALWSDRGIYPKLIDRAEETLGRWEERETVRNGRAYGLEEA